MSLLEPGKSTRVGPRKCNIAETQDKHFKMAIVNSFGVLKENMKKCTNEIYGNTNGTLTKTT